MDGTEELLARAREQAGLSDLGSDSWGPGLELLVAELADPVIDPGGRDRIHGELVGALVNRLRVTEYRRTHPEVLDERIERPLVILGMPRTGTTLASYLLDQDPRRRSLLNWEAAESVPPPTSASLRTDERCITKLQGQHEIFDMLVDMGISVPHWEWADGPTECIFVQNQDFKAFYWDAFLPGTAYSDWLLECDMSSAYEYEREVLQVLQSQAPGRWSLKMPSHAVHIETLLKVFPDVRMVWAHRDPYAALGSLCSAQRQAKGSMTGEVDMERIGRNSLVQMRAHIDRASAARDRLGDEPFFDLHYAALVRDPLGELRRLSEWDDLPLIPAVEAAMASYVAENPQGKHGRHSYTLEEYGLSVEQAEPFFGPYIERFGIEVDGA